MKTVIRNEEGIITHLLYVNRMYLTVEDHKTVDETPITAKMIREAFKSEDNLVFQLQKLLSEEASPKEKRFLLFLHLGLINEKPIYR